MDDRFNEYFVVGHSSQLSACDGTSLSTVPAASRFEVGLFFCQFQDDLVRVSSDRAMI